MLNLQIEAFLTFVLFIFTFLWIFMHQANMVDNSKQ